MRLCASGGRAPLAVAAVPKVALVAALTQPVKTEAGGGLLLPGVPTKDSALSHSKSFSVAGAQRCGAGPF